MEKLARILKDLEQGKISVDNAESQVLRLFSVSNAKRTCCPRCGSTSVSKDQYAPYNLWYCDNCFYKGAI
jgi:ribosomal protein L37AE/L43A